MSIAIDQKQCIGCGKCRMICPGSLIHQNETGKAFIKYPKAGSYTDLTLPTIA